MDIARINLLVGWIGVLGGIFSGALTGLFFHREAWMGGYSTFRRRMIRLGHISFWGLGFLNMMFAFSVRAVQVPAVYVQVASAGLILGALTMPLCCFLTARRESFRHLFPIPVICTLVGVLFLLAGWVAK